MTKTVKFVGKCLMLLAYIKIDGSIKLVKIDCNLNSTKYMQFLKNSLISDLDEGEIFQRNGAPSQRSRATQQNLIDEGVILLKDRLALNLDLNSI